MHAAERARQYEERHAFRKGEIHRWNERAVEDEDVPASG